MAQLNTICRHCGCTEAQAAADARAVGLLEEFRDAVYTCCQIVQWADEQWAAWEEAATEDGKPTDEVTRPLEIRETDVSLVPVPVRRPRDPRSDSRSGQ